MDYPPLDMSRFIARMPLHALPAKHRTWTGNDESAGNHNARIPNGEDTVFLELRWRANKSAPIRPVGAFRIELKPLVREGYLSPDPAGGVRLKFIHGSDGIVYLGSTRTGKRIPVGRPGQTD